MTLQPCPFCGWSHHEDCADSDTLGRFFWVACGKCEASGPTTRALKEAHRMWNVRPSEPDLGCEETER